jgi:hypothetical protein
VRLDSAIETLEAFAEGGSASAHQVAMVSVRAGRTYDRLVASFLAQQARTFFSGLA